MSLFLGLEEILLFVPDVQSAKPWYADFLGVDPVFDDPHYCAFRLCGVSIGLHPYDDKTPTRSTGPVPYWRVADIHQSIAQLQSKGCGLFRGPIFGVDQRWVCQMTDPFGNVWGLVQVY
ncbi:VOC family protein [Sulfobacillus sp. hq2]|uniref:VOC family protein n=1 Tax=Sulfobacillus TaxID=28033 RepID=UPI000CD06C57|nr:VOC family protein [Sulfobacillus sp. hq2]MCY0909605.1 bleomycin resistance protein [Sulfobacillus thermotolerans]POB09449.1 bleomycin resistance protein [Sulfobacillus sp. hq2]